MPTDPNGERGDEKPLRSIVIVGGGTAGWLTAGIIAAENPSAGINGVTVSLIESPNIPIIGVGEGTWPTMRSTLERLGISETDFLRECDASFKQGANFVNWSTGTPGDHYYHPLVLPEGYLDANLAPSWLESDAGVPFASTVCAQAAVCDADLAPKQITTPEYAAVLNYAYHLDAGKFAPFLQRHCTAKLGVRHIEADVIEVISADNGDIAAVRTAQHGDIFADLFIDCTGFRSLLLGGHYGVPFKSLAGTLFVDTAVAVQVPYETETTPIASHTISSAQSAGWIWDIGLWTRRGVGHVFSSAHTSENCAIDELRAYLRPRVTDVDRLDFRRIPIVAGRRERFWVRNCVAIGLAAGFLEPLESSAIVLVELCAQAIARQLPANRSAMEILARRYNRKFDYRWDRAVDFLKLHYVLSKRRDSDFWTDNRRPETIPDSLKELLELWEHQPPWHCEFDRIDEVFPSASYQYVLYGMGFRTRPGYTVPVSAQPAATAGLIARNTARTAQLVSALPTNRDLLGRIRQYGLQKI